MTLTPPAFRAHVEGVLTALTGAGLLAAVGRRPDNVPMLADGKTPKKAYAVIYPIVRGERSGPVSDPDADHSPTFQITCVGASADALAHLVDDVELALRNVAVAGRVVTRLEPLVTGDLLRDDDGTPPLYYATPRWRLHTTPA